MTQLEYTDSCGDQTATCTDCYNNECSLGCTEPEACKGIPYHESGFGCDGEKLTQCYQSSYTSVCHESTMLTDCSSQAKYCWPGSNYCHATPPPICNTDADVDCDGTVSINELINYITEFKQGSVNIQQLLAALVAFKGG